MTDESEKPPPTTGFQRWVEANRAKIWIWGIAILALGGVGCMFLTVLVLIIRR
jgi:hypothetical protein